MPCSRAPRPPPPSRPAPPRCPPASPRPQSPPACRTRPRWRSRPTAGSSSASRAASCGSSRTARCCATPFLTVTVSSSGERGLLGVAFDPDFATNHFVYVYYTATTPAVHNRVSRFTANGDVAVAGSETRPARARQPERRHQPQRRRASTSGPTASSTSRSARTPTARTRRRSTTCWARCCASTRTARSRPTTRSSARATGQNRAIWALGLRNPFTFAFQPGTGRMFINDVGQNTWEEINDGIAGANYGWPDDRRADHRTRRFRGPLLRLRPRRVGTTGCAITGGAFYNPTTAPVPGRLRRRLLLRRLLQRLDPHASTRRPARRHRLRHRHLAARSTCRSRPTAASTTSRAAAAASAASQYTGRARRPTITPQPANQTVVGRAARHLHAWPPSGTPPLTYQWQRNGAEHRRRDRPPPTRSPSAQLADNGATFRARRHQRLRQRHQQRARRSP